MRSHGCSRTWLAERSAIALVSAVVCAALTGCGAGPRPASPTAVRDAPVPASPDRAAPGPFSEARMMADVAWLVDPARAGRGSFQAASGVVADHIAAIFADLGLEVVRQPVAQGVDNVIGILRGDDRAVLVSAHYDHLGTDAAGVIYPGADDNASGVAVLLALARDATSGPPPARTVLFVAFGAEEPGLVGSRVYDQNPLWPLDRTVAVINFDMVGRNFFEAAAAREATCAIIGLEDHPELRAVARAAARNAGLHVVLAPARLLEIFGSDFRTDEWWFRHRGILSIHFSTGMHDDYHRPTDTMDKLVPAQLVRVARTARGILRSLAGQPGQDGPGERRGGRGGRDQDSE